MAKKRPQRDDSKPAPTKVKPALEEAHADKQEGKEKQSAEWQSEALRPLATAFLFIAGALIIVFAFMAAALLIQRAPWSDETADHDLATSVRYLVFGGRALLGASAFLAGISLVLRGVSAEKDGWRADSTGNTPRRYAPGAETRPLLAGAFLVVVAVLIAPNADGWDVPKTSTENKKTEKSEENPAPAPPRELAELIQFACALSASPTGGFARPECQIPVADKCAAKPRHALLRTLSLLSSIERAHNPHVDADPRFDSVTKELVELKKALCKLADCLHRGSEKDQCEPKQVERLLTAARAHSLAVCVAWRHANLEDACPESGS